MVAHIFTLPKVELREDRKYIRQEYIGFVLDAVNHYFDWGAKVYSLDGWGDISKISSARMFRTKLVKTITFTSEKYNEEMKPVKYDTEVVSGPSIRINKIATLENSIQYELDGNGLPEELDMERFQRIIPVIYESIINDLIVPKTEELENLVAEYAR